MDTEGINDAPLTPVGLLAIPANNSVTLNWDDNPEGDLAGYSVYRREAAGAYGPAIVEGLTDSIYTDLTVQNGSTYFYRVSASDQNGNESANSAEVPATPDLVVNVDLKASDNSFVRRDNGVQDAQEILAVKRNDWGNSFARIAYMRFPMVGDDSIGGIAADDLSEVSLKIYVTNNEPFDTLRIYALRDAAKSSAAALSESTWTGGTDGTVEGGNNLEGSNRPDGESALPNAFTTVELGRLTFAAGADTGPKEIIISDMAAFRTLVKNDTNGEITLIIRGSRDGLPNEFASIFNSSDNPGPTLAVKGEPPEDADQDGMADDWERLYFDDSNVSNGTGDFDSDGTLDFFEYLFGTNPTDSTETGTVTISPNLEGTELVFKWSVAEGMEVNVDYALEFSTDLSDWSALPDDDYVMDEDTFDGKTHVDLILIPDFGTKFFLQLIRD
jgi:hypothetical protein